MISSPMATDRIQVRTVCSGGTAQLTVLSITPVAGLMVGRRVGAGLIESRAQLISVVAANILNATIVTITDVSIATVRVCIAATQMVCPSMATYRVGVGTVVISATSVSTLKTVHITVVTVLVVRYITDLCTVSTQTVVPTASDTLGATATVLTERQVRGAVRVLVTATAMVAIPSTQGAVIGAVTILGTPNFTVLAIAPEAVIMGRNVADSIISRTVSISVSTARVWYAAIVTVTYIAIRAVRVIIAATQMVVSSIATDREHIRAVVVINATWLAVLPVTIEAVIMGRDIAHSIPTLAALIIVVTSV